jgi:hypothetical protein
MEPNRPEPMTEQMLLLFKIRQIYARIDVVSAEIHKIDTRIDVLSAYVRTIVDTCRGPLHKPSLTPIKKAVRRSPRFKQ